VTEEEKDGGVRAIIIPVKGYRHCARLFHPFCIDEESISIGIYFMNLWLGTDVACIKAAWVSMRMPATAAL
jgi:hypothetical protein